VSQVNRFRVGNPGKAGWPWAAGAKWATRAEKWERKKGELGRNQGTWATQRRKEEKREVGHAESNPARKRNRLPGFRLDKVKL
jgi:hypothetical protein